MPSDRKLTKNTCLKLCLAKLIYYGHFDVKFKDYLSPGFFGVQKALLRILKDIIDEVGGKSYGKLSLSFVTFDKLNPSNERQGSILKKHASLLIIELIYSHLQHIKLPRILIITLHRRIREAVYCYVG